MTAFAVEKLCLAKNDPPVEILRIDNIGTKSSLQAIGKIMDRGVISTLPLSQKAQHRDAYFFASTLAAEDCFYFRTAETMRLMVDNVVGDYMPFVQINASSMQSSYGLVQAAQIKDLPRAKVSRTTSVQNILDYPIDPKATVIYVVCPKVRDELCSLKIKHQGKWLSKGGKTFELKVLARSRRERGSKTESQRLLKDGDTPQGIYQLWGTLWTLDRKFGAQPRIDIDGMHTPLVFEQTDQQKLARVLPPQTFADYWLHEFALAQALGRYLFRIHDNSVDPNYPNTYTTPKSKQTLRASAGCLNTGDNMQVLLQVLFDLGIFSQEQIQNQAPYGRIETKNPDDVFLLIIDEDA